MALTLELPRPLDEELTQEAAREGVSVEDHATLLLYLVNAVVAEEQTSAFKQAVREYLSSHNLDIEHMTTVFESLLRLCLFHETGKASSDFQSVVSNGHSAIDVSLLRDWRNGLVHGLNVSALPKPSALSREQTMVQTSNRGNANPDNLTTTTLEEARIRAIHAARGRMKHVNVSVDDLHRERQRDKEKEEEAARVIIG